MPVTSAPTGCPPRAALQVGLNSLQAYVVAQGSSVGGFVSGSSELQANIVGQQIDRLNAYTRCMSSAQLHQFLKITETWKNRAHAQESTASAVTDPLVAVNGFLGKLTDPVTWVRVGEFIGGAVLVLMGIKALAAQQGLSVPGVR